MILFIYDEKKSHKQILPTNFKTLNIFFFSPVFFKLKHQRKSPKKPSMIENKDRLTNEQKIDNLMRWLTVDHPYKMKMSPNVKVASDAHGGIGLYYEQNQALPITNEIIHIPSFFFINKLNCLKHFENNYTNENSVWFKFFQCNQEINLSDIKNVWNSFNTIILYIYLEWFCSTKPSFHLPFFQTFPPSSFFEENIPVLQLLKLEDMTIDTKPIIENLPIEFKVEFNKLYNNVKAAENQLLPLIGNFCGGQINVPEAKKRIRYIYMCINSRCLYYEISRTNSRNEDNLTLVPLVDFINHSNDQNEVNARAETTKNTIQLDKQDYKIYFQESENSEILFKYGHHSDDLLLNDYGFILSNYNDNNHLDVTEILFRRLKDVELDYLKQSRYYNDGDRLCISADNVLYPNTQIVVYVLSLNKELSNLKNLKTFPKPKELKVVQFIKSRRTNSVHYQLEIDSILNEYNTDSQQKYKSLSQSDNVPSNIMQLIKKRISK